MTDERRRNPWIFGIPHLALPISFSLVLLSGCQGGDRTVEVREIPRTPAHSASTSPDDAVAAPHAGGGLTWTTPEGWRTKPASSMRLASFEVPLSDGSAGDCSIIVLGGTGGGLLPNINRWRGQIGLPPIGEEGLADAIRPLEGQIQDMKFIRLENPDDPSRAFLIAIAPLGNRTAYVKLSAPREQLDAVEPAFLDLARSLKAAP